MSALIECVPNFSEGRDPDVIRQITDAHRGGGRASRCSTSIPGKATNRTVVTFAGAPEPVVEAAFRAIPTAAELIDMRRHTGEHPRMGATDVCPLVPISGHHHGGDRALRPATGRAGRPRAPHPGLPLRGRPARSRPEEPRGHPCRRVRRPGARSWPIPRWTPDFGPAEFNPRSGATVIGARDFLVAYNVNLNTTSTRRANAVAFDVRESGPSEARRAIRSPARS